MGCCCSKPVIKETYTSGSVKAIIINPKDYYKFPQINEGYGYTVNEKHIIVIKDS
jgi:hypothetical protein